MTLGLTGSIGMGKSTTAGFFADVGIPVWDADAAVHRVYEAGGAGAPALAELVPDAIRDGAVDRVALRAAILDDQTLLKQIEMRIHPLVGADRATFLAKCRDEGAQLVLLDIPLLFETGGEATVDKVLVVTAPASVQRDRVLARPGMTDEAFETILARQVPDALKRTRADYVIDTSKGMDHARDRVLDLIAELTGRDPRDA